jgi:hypothetical protein
MDTKVLIAVPTGEFARRADFYDFFSQIDRPVGTLQTSTHGQSPAESRNIMIQQAVDHKCTHIFFLDDDCCPEPDIIKRLLAHDKDIVSGLYLHRNYPFKPLMFDKFFDNGYAQYTFLTNERGGLIPTVAGGLGACLIKMSVFDRLEKPYIRLGELTLDHWCDDIGFFFRAAKAGIEMFTDLDCLVGHFATGIIKPQRMPNGDWMTSFHTNGAGVVHIPQVIPTEAEINKDLEKAGLLV